VGCPKCKLALKVPISKPAKPVPPAIPPLKPKAIKNQISKTPPPIPRREETNQWSNLAEVPTLGRRRRNPGRKIGPTLFIGFLAFVLLLGGVAATAFYFGNAEEKSAKITMAERDAPKKKEEKAPRKSPVLPVGDKEKKTPENPNFPDPETEPNKQVVEVAGTPIEQALALLNGARAKEEVSKLRFDPVLSRACSDHANYWVQNELEPAALIAGRHAQDSALPDSTRSGQEVANRAIVASADVKIAMQAWLKAPGHRSALLRPDLRGVGIATKKTSGGRWITVLDAGAARALAIGKTRAVLYPSLDQSLVPLAFPGNELPDPIPEAKQKLAGFPITATFEPRARVLEAQGFLEDEQGRNVPGWFSSAEKPANRQYDIVQQNTLCFIARAPLDPDMRYTVLFRAKVDGKPWSRTWTFVTAPEARVRTDMNQAVLARLNSYRKGAGIGTLTLDHSKSAACAAHAKYLTKNIGSHPNLEWRREDENLPGYSKKGNDVARLACIRLGGGPGGPESVDWLVASLVNRSFVLNPNLKMCGIGASQFAPSGWTWVMDLASPWRGGAGPDSVLFPSPGQESVPLAYARESPSPIPGGGPEAGYMVTVSVPIGVKIKNVSGKLEDPEGNEIACWVHSPEKPLTAGLLPNVAGLLPKKVLNPATQYKVRLSFRRDGRPWQKEWTFTTIDLDREGKRVAAALLRQLNDVRRSAGLEVVELDAKLSKGCQQHARYVSMNFGKPALQGLGIHEENTSLPGATPEGKAAGKGSVIATLADPVDSIDGWIATLYHRIPLLDPKLKRVGYGQSTLSNGNWVTVFNSGSGREG
jgi:uncharacterized protein YkwD